MDYLKLLRAAVEHIEAFEEDEAENVLKALGFTKNVLAIIKAEIHIRDEDKGNIFMVEDKIFHNGELVWVLSYEGDKYIFSDEKETETGYETECVPFKNYHHYVYIDDDNGIYTGYAWYNKYESYVNDFDNLEKCLDWLVGEEE